MDEGGTCQSVYLYRVEIGTKLVFAHSDDVISEFYLICNYVLADNNTRKKKKIEKKKFQKKIAKRIFLNFGKSNTVFFS